MLQVGKKAPDFVCSAVINNHIKQVSLSDHPTAYKLLFFYPLDFTFVCPTELHALQENSEAFAQRNVVVMGISVDSVHSHLSWLSVPKSRGGIEGISYPLLSDLTKSIARSYEVLNEEIGVALRGVFLLDKENVIQYAAVHNLSLGRNISELLRVVDALIHVEQYGEVCPADWSVGKKAMKPTSAGVQEYFGK